MLKIYKKQGSSYLPPVSIRPTPFVSISHSPQKNNVGYLGCTYDIVLTGTIIAHLGSPKFENSQATFDDNHPSTNVETGDLLKSIVLKQNKIRDLFSGDGNKIEIFAGNRTIYIVPTFVDIVFEEGIYIDTCKYTINLQSHILFDENENVYTEGLIGLTFAPNKYDENRDFNEYLRETQNTTRKSIDDVINRWGGFIEDFSDTWSLEVDEANGQTFDNTVPYTYILTRNMNAVGKMIFDINGNKQEAWKQAFGFIKKSLLQEPNGPPDGSSYNLDDNEKYRQYPAYFPKNSYADDFINIPSDYNGFNHTRTVNIDKSGGSCTVVDSWVLAKGQSHLENYTMSIERAIDDGLITVKLDGSIKGLSELHPRDYNNDSNSFDFDKSPYTKALNKYNAVSNNGSFGFNSLLYQRVANVVGNTFINPQPLGISIGSNENNGEITYSISFNNRPCSFFDGVLYENINLSDNYPGDVYSIIPVLGRKTGPILQYSKARTEYNRNVNIEILLDYKGLSSSNIPGLPPTNSYDLKTNLSLNKPSLNFPFRTQLETLVQSLSPANEPFVTRFFLKPPVETWQPLEGRYTLSLTWDYEKAI